MPAKTIHWNIDLQSQETIKILFCRGEFCGMIQTGAGHAETSITTISHCIMAD
jgi:hypothetical protein